MTGIATISIEADDATAAESFYKEAFDLGDTLTVRESQAPTSGFRGFTISLVVSQPSTSTRWSAARSTPAPPR